MHALRIIIIDFNRELLIKMPRTSAIHCKVDRSNGNTHITQDVVRAILWVLPGRSCAVSFAIAIMSSEQCLHICNTIATHPVLTSSDHSHSSYSSSIATVWHHTVWMYVLASQLCSWQRFCTLVAAMILLSFLSLGSLQWLSIICSKSLTEILAFVARFYF